MDLKKRLAQLDKLTRRPETLAAAARTGPPGEQPDQAEVLAGLGLTRQETPVGPVWSLEHLDTATPPPDPLPSLGGLFTREPDHCPALKQVLFLDTETTGLAGGTGTLVFQLGVSWWQDWVFRTRQYFLPGPGNELAMLTALGELAQNFTAIVTFNGASFDLPLLRTRSLLNRLADPLAHLVSWDLLVPARRLWGNRLPDCRQQTLEVDICGRERASGDIDGARIPQTWFDFLASGQPGLLDNVLTHNHRDMVGMAEIFSRVCRLGKWLAADPGRDAEWPAADLAADRAGNWRMTDRIKPRSSSVWFMFVVSAVRYALGRDSARALSVTSISLFDESLAGPPSIAPASGTSAQSMDRSRPYGRADVSLVWCISLPSCRRPPRKS